MGGSASISSRASASLRSRGEHPATHRTGVANVGDESAGVDPGDGLHSAVGEPVEPAALGARRILAVARLAHDGGTSPRALGLHRLAACAVVADVRVGVDDQLPGEGGIGHGLLVAGHPGCEDDLADGVTVGGADVAVKAHAILEKQVSACVGHLR